MKLRRLPFDGRELRGAWTDDRVTRLRTLWGQDGMTAEKIAAQLGPGITKASVSGKAGRLGLPHSGRWPQK